MSEPKIKKELRLIEERNRDSCKRVLQPAFVLSDSKGGYLKREQEGSGHNGLEFVYRGGAKSTDQDLKRIIFQKIRHVRKPIVFIWFGTCELTVKQGRCISLINGLNNKNDELIDSYRNLRREILEVNRNSVVVFIECPYFSIYEWNRMKGNCSEEDKSANLELKVAIDNLNYRLAELNTVSTPRISLDLIASCKKKGKSTSYKVNYRLLTDGVHPSQNLARLWLRKVVVLANTIAETSQ